ncbi:MAG: hypothetical protein ACRD2J_01120 [Thermoanaerobaculia bacterium]
MRDLWRRRAKEHEGLSRFAREDGTPRADDPLLSGERNDHVRRLVAELPPAMAEAVALRYFEELSGFAAR